MNDNSFLLVKQYRLPLYHAAKKVTSTPTSASALSNNSHISILFYPLYAIFMHTTRNQINWEYNHRKDIHRCMRIYLLTGVGLCTAPFSRKILYQQKKCIKKNAFNSARLGRV